MTKAQAQRWHDFQGVYERADVRPVLPEPLWRRAVAVLVAAVAFLWLVGSVLL